MNLQRVTTSVTASGDATLNATNVITNYTDTVNKFDKQAHVFHATYSNIFLYCAKFTEEINHRLTTTTTTTTIIIIIFTEDRIMTTLAKTILYTTSQFNMFTQC